MLGAWPNGNRYEKLNLSNNPCHHDCIVLRDETLSVMIKGTRKLPTVPLPHGSFNACKASEHRHRCKTRAGNYIALYNDVDNCHS